MADLRLVDFKIVMIRGTSPLESVLHCNNCEETLWVKLTPYQWNMKRSRESKL